MNTISAYDTFNLFSSLKLHFTTSYDYFKYNGKSKSITKENFAIHKDRFKYQKLARLFNTVEELKDYIIANLLKEKKWIGEFLDDSAMDNYKEFLKTKESLSYVFSNDIDKLNKNSFIENNGEIEVYKLYKHRKISLESFVILEHYIRFFKNIDKFYGKEDIIWKPIRNLSEKYVPFIKWDNKKFANILTTKLLTD